MIRALERAGISPDIVCGTSIGALVGAVRASIALPGLFTPVEHDGRLLVDGGLVNPVPVSLCRAMGARPAADDRASGPQG